MIGDAKGSKSALVPALFDYVSTIPHTDCPKAGHAALLLLERLVREQRSDPVFHEPREHLRNVVENRLSDLAQRRRCGDIRGSDFTDFTYDIRVPRNPATPANADPAYVDQGLCGPFRTDLAQRTDLCGAFKVPTLRNVAVTAPYFHNGRFKTLKEVVGFYVRRDTNPEEWYPVAADGSVRKFDDLPPQYHGNANVTEVPYNRHLGDAPALTPDEIDLVVEFLNTLTNHYQP